MNQPAAAYTEADLDRVIARDFPPGEIRAVKALLARYGHESWHGETLRVQMACLKCANGNLQVLEREVKTAGEDYRDVLAAAEYPSYMRAYTDAAKQKAIESDWKQLQTWLHRK
jgi:hypothetical protein